MTEAFARWPGVPDERDALAYSDEPVVCEQCGSFVPAKASVLTTADVRVCHRCYEELRVPAVSCECLPPEERDEP